MFKVLLVSVFEGGYPPLTVASAITPLVEAGFEVAALDTYVEGIKPDLLLQPNLVAISIPLFDSIHPALEVVRQVRQLNPKAHITFFGQYAIINSKRLVGKYSDTCIAGEWEGPLVGLAQYLSGSPVTVAGLGDMAQAMLDGVVSIPSASNRFSVPTRHLLPPLAKYPQPQVAKLCGKENVIGSTETTRGCHHKCVYCSVFAAYHQKFLVVPEEIVLQDVRNLVAAGMTHLTLFDADFLNSKNHSVKVLQKLHAEFPELTYDFTARVDHILENKPAMHKMAEWGVRFITTAIEFPAQHVLDMVVKDFSVGDIEEATEFLRKTGIKLNPSFVIFNPWINLEDLVTFQNFVDRNGLAEIIEPIQYETRLHLYKGSPLLELPSVQALELVEKEFMFEWKHPDPRVDEAFRQIVTPPEAGVFKRCCLKC